MHLHEFELRYRSYLGLSSKFDLGYDSETLLSCVHRTEDGQLVKKLTETEPSELKVLTQESYTEYKKTLIQYSTSIQIKDFNLADYIHRLEYELKVVHEMGYDSYLLVVQDYINRAKTNHIGVGPGRGSAAGSLVSWCVGITDVDPLPYGLLFERFLNPARVSMPDIDVDFEDTLRDQVIDYIKNRYGHDKVASIGTFMKMGSKAAFKDVARAMGISFERANAWSNFITGKTLEESLQLSEELKNLQESDELVATTIKYAQGLEGTIRQIGVHACGMIIAPRAVVEYSAVQYPPIAGKNDVDRTKLVTQFDGHLIEDIGLLKMDFLGLRNLSIIKNTIKILYARTQKQGTVLPPSLSSYLETMNFTPPIEDTLTYQSVFQTGDTSGVFQFESDGMRNYLSKLKPTDINDIAAMGALYRPGPMEFIPRYIARKHGQEAIRYMTDELAQRLESKYGKVVVGSEQAKLDEDLSPFLGLTYGIPVYQEQLMFLVQAMAGFSLAEADLLRRGIGKKIKEIIEKIKIDFVHKCAQYRGYKPETSTYIYETMIEPAALYSFNKSHAVAYGLISYQTAYLKANYPLEFHAALLRSVEDDTEKFAKFIGEIKIKGIKILPPNVNESYNHVAAIDDHIRLGFVCIKGVGYDVGEFIQTTRQNGGSYKDLEDFLTRCQTIVNKKSIDALIKSGSLDQFGDRASLLESMMEILEWSKQNHQAAGGSLFDSMGPTLVLRSVTPISHRDKLLGENEVFKTFISGHPFDGLYEYIKSKHHFISMFKNDESFGATSFVGYVSGYTRAKKKGFFLKIEDISGTIELFVKDMMDIKKFDILIIEGFKGKSFKLQKIIKTSLDLLIHEATKSEMYVPSETIAIVSQKRGMTIASSAIQYDIDQGEKNEQDNSISETPRYDDQNDTNKNIINNELETQTTKDVFTLPSSIDTLHILADLIKNNPGDCPITIGSKKYLVSSIGYDQINTLLA